MFHILDALFQAQVKYLNTKNQPLIANGLIKNCEQIKSFLLQLHPTLDVNRFSASSSNDKHKSSAQYLANKLREQMIRLLHFYDGQLQQQQSQLQPQSQSQSQQYDAMILALAQQFMAKPNGNNNNTHHNMNYSQQHINQFIPSPSHTVNCPHRNLQNNNHPQAQPQPTIIIRPVIVPVAMAMAPQNNNIHQINGYNATHGANRVIHQRYNPMFNGNRPPQNQWSFQ